MHIRIEHDLEAMVLRLRRGPERVVLAQVHALNDVAFDARAALQQDMREQFDRVTPYMVRSVWVETATDRTLEARVWPRYMGGKGVDPAKILLAQVRGGPRRSKRFEIALQRAGILPTGMAAVPAGGLDPAHIDAYGNVKGSFIVQLLAYLKAFGEQGYRANLSDKRRDKLAKRGRTEKGHATINGVEYFVSYGRGERNGRMQHLPAGIWSRSGIHGSIVKPVFLWSKRMPSYTKTIDLRRLAEASVRRKYQAAFARRLGRVLR
jgi:hypothetical protein